MSYIDIPRVKRSVADQLAAVLPNDIDGLKVRVDYAWPGAEAQRPVHIWFFGGRLVSEPDGQMSGRRRRDQTVTLPLVIEVQVEGRTLDGQGYNVLQEKADGIVNQIVGMIDEWLADNPTAGQTSSDDVPVDAATFGSFTLQEGLSATGATARGTCEISLRMYPK